MKFEEAFKNPNLFKIRALDWADPRSHIEVPPVYKEYRSEYAILQNGADRFMIKINTLFNSPLNYEPWTAPGGTPTLKKVRKPREKPA